MFFHFLLPLTANDARLPSAIPEKEMVAYIRQLVEAVKGESNNTDFGGPSEADNALTSLEEIGPPVIPYVMPLLDTPTGWAKLHAVQILAKLQVKQAAPKVDKIMRFDPEPGIRAAVAFELGKFGDTSFTNDLLDAAVSDDKQLAQGAWASLGDLREPRAIPILIANLSNRASGQLAFRADEVPVGSLVQIGEPAVDPLIKAMKDATGSAQQQAARALGLIGTRKAVECLKTAMQDPGKRDAAIDGLLEIGTDAAVSVACTVLFDDSHGWSAQSYLTKHPTANSVVPLRVALQMAVNDQNAQRIDIAAALLTQADHDPDVELLCAAAQVPDIGMEPIEALAATRDRRAIPILAKIATTETGNNNNQEYFAASKLAGFGRPAVAALADRVKLGASPELIGEALSLFSDLSVSAEIKKILSMTDKDPVRAGALTALGRMKDQSSKSLLLAALGDNSREVQNAAARGLALLGDPAAIPYLLKMSEGNANIVLDLEWTALGDAADPAIGKLFLAGDWSARTVVRNRGPKPFMRFLEEGLESSDPLVPYYSATALKDSDDRTAIPMLLKAFRRPDPFLRFAAFQTLQKLSD